MTLNIYIRGEHYKVDKHGCIFGGPNDVKPTCINGHEWKFLGVSTHHWHKHIVHNFKDIVKNPELARHGYFWDIDHGATRVWGGSYYGRLPRITSAWVDK